MKSKSLLTKPKFILLIFAAFLAFTSCKNNHTLADGGWLQKRRYQKGYHLNIKSSPPKENPKNLAVKPMDLPLVASLDSESILENSEPAKTVQVKPDAVSVVDINVADQDETNATPNYVSPKLTVKSELKVKSNQNVPDDYYEVRKVNTLALLSFIFAIASFFILGIPFGIAAVVCGIIGLVQITEHPDKFKGRGFAIVGIIIGLIAVVLVLGAAS